MQLNVIVGGTQIQNVGSYNFFGKRIRPSQVTVFYLFFAFAFDLDFALAFAIQSISLHGY